MRRIVGLDLNGWRDYAARDWSLDDDETIESSRPATEQNKKLHLLDGGAAAVVVAFEDRGHVGGPQAILSPIGRGGGWGEVGRIDKRRQISDLLRLLLAGSIDARFKSQIQAAVDAMSASAQDVVLTVPDRPGFDDARQQLLLDSLTGPRRKSVRLLWRPVGIVLSALEANLLPRRDGLRIICLSHADDGVERQSLLLRRLADYPGVFAPERAGCGELVGSNVGLCSLLTKSERLTEAANPHLLDAKHEPSRLPVRSLLEGAAAGTVEILRLDNGTWIQARAAHLRAPDFFPDDVDLGHMEGDVALLSTPLAGPLREEFIARMQAASGTTPLIVLPNSSVAHGALVAGRRIEQDIPHYLDRLEQISLVVIRDGEPSLADLMPAEAIVEANREYASPPITNLSWPAGVGSIDFYIRKGGEFRKWRTQDRQPPVELQPVEIRLRQTPAQGRAKLFATSSTWQILRANPVFLDWSKLLVDTRSFEEIALDLKPRPLVPKRVTAMTHPDVWQGAQPFKTISEMLKAFSVGDQTSLRELSDALRRTYRIDVGRFEATQQIFENFRAVDYDGNIPEGVDPKIVAKFDDALLHVSDYVRNMCAAKRGRLQSNQPMMVATWAFGRCPKPLQDEMLRALAARLADKAHPLLAPLQGYKVLLHGLGRCVIDADRLAKLVDLIAPNLAQPNFLAALSSVLSRPVQAPEVLSDARVKLIAENAAIILADLARSRKFATNLKYALLAVGGLLRVRKRDPYALITSRSGSAQKLVAQLQNIHVLLKQYRGTVKKADQKLLIVADLIEMLTGQGGNVGVLVATESLDDEED